MRKNNLINDPSPYLQQHKNNPVHWQIWSKSTLAQAKKENKPILLSVGYASCHWCHVMAHESFEDIGTAEIMNKKFVNIKEKKDQILILFFKVLFNYLINLVEDGHLQCFLTKMQFHLWVALIFQKSQSMDYHPLKKF